MKTQTTRHTSIIHDVKPSQIRITKFIRGKSKWISFEIADGEHSNISEIAMMQDDVDGILQAIIDQAKAALGSTGTH